jgi:hypothetical protein
MDGDLGNMLQSVLSDPAQMEKIAQMAKGLMGSMGQPSPPSAQETSPVQETSPAQETDAVPMSPVSGVSEADSRLISSLGKMFSGSQEKSRSTALLMAMRPYMRPEKQEKLDHAMKIAQMVHIAGAVMQAYSGGSRGL